MDKKAFNNSCNVNLHADTTVYWTGVTQQVQNRVENCGSCLKFSSAQQKQPISQETARISISNSIHGRKEMFLATVDHFSDFRQHENGNCHQPRHGHPEIICKLQ